MTRKSTAENLARVKTELAEKYERLARTTKSKPRRANWLRVAERHRAQAAVVANSAGK